MAEKQKKFSCPLKDCKLTEEMINKYDNNQYEELQDLMEVHEIEIDEVTNSNECKIFLYEHVMLRDMRGQGQDKIGPRANIVHDAVNAHQVRRENLLEIAKKIQQFFGKLPSGRKKELKRYFSTLDKDFERTIEDLQDTKCPFIVAGETGSGKSCFLNLLTGEQNFLPVKNVPSTSCLCEIMYGETGKITAFGQDNVMVGKPEELTVQNMTQKLSEFTHQKEDRDAIKYSKVEVEWPLEWLKSGLTIIDSPGVGERPEITAMVKKMMPKAYGFIYVINTTKAGGIQPGELQDLLLVPTDDDGKVVDKDFDPRTAIFIFNKWDLVDNEEKQKVKDFVCQRLKDIYKDINTDTQMFFLSTKQATDALRKKYVTEEYQRVLEGIERLMEFSMKSKMKTHYRFLSERLSKCIHIVKAYLGNYDDFAQHHREVTDKLKSLEHARVQVRQELSTKLKAEVERIVNNLKNHLEDQNVRNRLCRWDEDDCPKVEVWDHLARSSRVKAYERVEAEIKKWEEDNNILQKANECLLEVFREKFVSLKDKLASIEVDMVGNIDEKEVKKMMGEINNDVLNDDDFTVSTKTKVIIGVTAPIWVPLGLVVGLVTAPILIGYVVKEIYQDQKKEKKKYQEYHSNQSLIPKLMREETLSIIAGITNGDGLKDVVEKRLTTLVKKYIALIDKIPEFISADKELLNGLKKEYAEGINKETRRECNVLYDIGQERLKELDHFFMLQVHEDDLDPKSLTIGMKIGAGAFGDVFEAILKNGTDTKKVAVKMIKSPLEIVASDIKVEHNNLNKLQSENIVQYFGLCMKKREEIDILRNSDQDYEDYNQTKDITVPLMVMQLCDCTLTDIIEDKKKYVGPGLFKSEEQKKEKPMALMASTSTLTDIIEDKTKYVGPGLVKSEEQKKEKAMAVMASIAMQIANGLKTIHNLKLAHRDIKPANILVQIETSGENPEYKVQLADFGLTKKEQDLQKTGCGTLLYMAPEVLRQESYNKSCDIFSYGLILVELFYSTSLFDITHVDVRYRPTEFRGNPLSRNSPPENWVDIIKKCFDKLPGNRPTAEKCFDFFREHTDLSSC